MRMRQVIVCSQLMEFFIGDFCLPCIQTPPNRFSHADAQPLATHLRFYHLMLSKCFS